MTERTVRTVRARGVYRAGQLADGNWLLRDESGRAKTSIPTDALDDIFEDVVGWTPLTEASTEDLVNEFARRFDFGIAAFGYAERPGVRWIWGHRLTVAGLAHQVANQAIASGERDQLI